MFVPIPTGLYYRVRVGLYYRVRAYLCPSFPGVPYSPVSFIPLFIPASFLALAPLARLEVAGSLGVIVPRYSSCQSPAKPD